MKLPSALLFVSLPKTSSAISQVRSNVQPSYEICRLVRRTAVYAGGQISFKVSEDVHERKPGKLDISL